MGCLGSKKADHGDVPGVEDQTFSHLFKLVLLGDSNVGKSSLILRYCDNTFIETSVGSIGSDFKVKFVTVNKKKIKLQIWDTAGQEKYRQMTQSYFGGANGVILCFDLSADFDTSSKNMVKWMTEAKSLKTTVMTFFLVGCKSDLPRQVTEEQCQEFAQSMGATYFETSSKANKNIEETFLAISNQCYDAAY